MRTDFLPRRRVGVSPRAEWVRVRAEIFSPLRETAFSASLRVASPVEGARPASWRSLGMRRVGSAASVARRPSVERERETSGASSATPFCWNWVAQDSAA